MFKYEDVNNFNGSQTYLATNEEVLLHNDVLDRAGVKKLKRVLSICSGGEVPFFCLAPRAKEVVAVDHGYMALAMAMIKAILLKTHGALDARAKLTTSADVFNAAVQSVWPQLPSELQAKVDLQHFLTGGYFRDVRKEWKLTSVKDIKYAAKYLDRIRYVHGDLSDVPGPFDLVYVSNAPQHSSRFGLDNDGLSYRYNANPKSSQDRFFDRLESVLVPGTYVLYPGTYKSDSTYFHTPQRMTLVAQEEQCRSSWWHNLFQVTEPAVKEKAA
jgi:hypothetical protein